MEKGKEILSYSLISVGRVKNIPEGQKYIIINKNKYNKN
jgi:hypothetical protein